MSQIPNNPHLPAVSSIPYMIMVFIKCISLKNNRYPVISEKLCIG